MHRAQQQKAAQKSNSNNNAAIILLHNQRLNFCTLLVAQSQIKKSAQARVIPERHGFKPYWPATLTFLPQTVFALSVLTLSRGMI